MNIKSIISRIIKVVVSTLFVIVVIVSMKSVGTSESNTTSENTIGEQCVKCEYLCHQRPQRREHCHRSTSSISHGGKPKLIHATIDDAVCWALADIRDYPNDTTGHKVYECSGHYHLTTTLPNRRPIEKGKILDINGREINDVICGRLAGR